MARDYTHHMGGGVPLGALAAILVVILAAGAFGWAWTDGAPQRLADAKQWTVKGPPCAPVSRQAFEARGVATRERLDYADIKFDRAYGHVSCAQIYDQGGRGFLKDTVCEFSSPTALIVRTGKGDVFYAPKVGQPVTITVSHGRPACVIGAPEWPTVGS